MKNYYYLLIILFISCNSGNGKADQSIKEVAVIEGFSISKENSSITRLSTDKLMVLRNTDNSITQLIEYNNGFISAYSDNHETILNEDGVYVVVTEADVKVLNTSSKRNDTQLFKLIKHSAGLNSLLGVKVKNMYVSDSCEATGTDIEGIERTQTFKFDQFLDLDIKQLIVDTEDGIFIYKIDLENEPVIYEGEEPIYKLSVRSWYSFSDRPVEKVFLDANKKFIETKEVAYVDHSQSMDESSFEWKSNNKKQVFTINRINLIKNIQDEI